MLYVQPGATFTAVLEGAATGQLANLTVGIQNTDGTEHTAPTNAGIVEIGGGIYAKDDMLAPSAEGTYLVLWRLTGTPYASEELVVTYDLPTDADAGPGYVSAAEARQRSPLLAAAYPPEGGDADLNALLVTASYLVGELTCRALMASQTGEAVPAHLADLAQRAVVLKAEQMHVKGGSARARTSAVGAGSVQSFSAGPYSESYFGPDQAAKARVLDLDPALHEVLWLLATEDCRGDWLATWTGEYAPGAAVAHFDWRYGGAEPY